MSAEAQHGLANYVPIHIEDAALQTEAQHNADYVWLTTLRNGKRIATVVGEAIPYFLNGTSHSLAHNIHVATSVLPDVLPQQADVQLTQIHRGCSTIVCAESRRGWTPIRYLTLYRTEATAVSPLYAEMGTGASIPLEGHESYSTVGMPQQEYPGIGTELYKAAFRLLDQWGAVGVGTTTGIPPLLASLKAGAIAGPRSLFNKLTAEGTWRDVCAPCPTDKIYARDHASCRRAIEDPMNEIQSIEELMAQYNLLVQKGVVDAGSAKTYLEWVLSQCIWRYYVPLTAADYGPKKTLLDHYGFTAQAVDLITRLKTSHADRLV